jgi:hypothetical protein
MREIPMSPQPLSLQDRIRRNPDVVAAEAGKDIVMVSIESGCYYGVSDVAREIWEAIERPTKISDLIDGLAANYKVDRFLCEEQTLVFLESLFAEDLLEVIDGPLSS